MTSLIPGAYSAYEFEQMSVIDLITRVDAICRKYEKYDVDKHKELNVAGDDAFARLYGVFEADVEVAIQVR